MATKKRRRSQVKSKYIEALKHQMQENDLLDDTQMVFTDTRGPKLSAVLLDFIEPYQEDAPTHEAYEKLITMAIISWNAAILTGKERKELIHSMLNAIVGMAGEEWRKDTESIIRMMIKRKERYFADDKRFIVDYRLAEAGADNEYHLSVASVVKT